MRGDVTAIDQAALPIVARCDEREQQRKDDQQRAAALDYLAFLNTRSLADRHRDIATLTAAVEWARGEVPEGEPAAVLGFRANIVLAAGGAPA